MIRLAAVGIVVLATVACSPDARDVAARAPDSVDARELCIDETLAAVVAYSAGAGSTAENLEALRTVETLVGGRGPRFDWVVQNGGKVTRGRVEGGNEGAQRALDALEARLRGQDAADAAAAGATGSTPSSELCQPGYSPEPLPSISSPVATAGASKAATGSLPDLTLGCEKILAQVAPRLLRDPNGVLQEMAATYGRAGDAVIDAAFNISEDPRLETDPEAVAEEACRD